MCYDVGCVIRSHVEPYEVCLQVSFPCYAIDPGFKIYFIEDRGIIKSIVNKGQGKLSQKDQNPLLRGIHSLSPSNVFLVFRDIFKPNNCGRVRFYVSESQVSKESLIKVFFFVLRSSVIGLYTKLVVITNN